MSENKLPKDWKWVKLGAVAEITSSKRIFQHEYVSNGIPFYRTKEIKELSEGKDLTFDLFISNEKYNEIKNRFAIPKKGDVLLSAVGTIGISYIIKNDKPFYFKDGNLMWLRNLNGIEPKFLSYGLTNFIKNRKGAKTSGSAYSALTIETIKNFKFPLPSSKNQQAIVSKIEELFSELDKGIEDLKTAQQQLKTYRQSVLKWAFENLKNEKSIEEITQESLIGLVRSNAFQNFNGIGVPYVKMNNIDMNGSIDFKDLTYIEANDKEIEKYSLKKDDILLNTRNSFELVGKTGIVRENYKNVLFNNNLLRIRVKLDYSPLFILYQLVGPYLRKQMLKEKKATTSVCALYQRDILPLKVKITNIEQQHLIVQEIECRLSVADKMEESIAQSLQQAEALRQSILKKAFSGQLL